MKKIQYSLSIVLGIVIGALVALTIGNTTTAILAGVISAGATAWMGSLQWSKAGEFAMEVADRTGVAGLGTVRGVLCLTVGAGKAVKWLLLAPIKLTALLITNVNARKTGLAILTTLSIMAVGWYYLALVASSEMLAVQRTLIFALFSTAILVEILAAGVATVLALISVLAILRITVKDGTLDPHQAANRRKLDANNPFTSWFYQVLEDDRGAIASVARMLWIRLGNALRILVHPFILIPWGIIALASNRTGASALTAMALSGIYLSVAYLAGGINTGNANFWLSLIVAMGIGVVLGKEIHMMAGPATHRPLPSIKFRDQVAFKRS